MIAYLVSFEGCRKKNVRVQNIEKNMRFCLIRTLRFPDYQGFIRILGPVSMFPSFLATSLTTQKNEVFH